MVFRRFLRLLRIIKTRFLFVNLFLLGILIWQHLKWRVPNSRVLKSKREQLVFERTVWSNKLKNTRTPRLRTKRYSFNGLIRININDFPQDYTPKELEKDRQDVRRERPNEITEHPWRIEDVDEIRKPEKATFTISKIEASIGVTAKNASNVNLNKFNSILMTPGRAFLTNASQKYLKSNQSPHKTIKNAFKNPVLEKKSNISHTKRREPKLPRGKEQLRNLKQRKRSNLNESQFLEGYLNIHLWFDICDASINSLRNFLLFPIASNQRIYASTLNRTLKRINYGQWMFGYLKAPSSGNYYFAISSRGNVELWLSTDGNQENIRIIARTKPRGISPGINLGQSNVNVSMSVELKSDELYYIEVLHKHGKALNDHFEITWRDSSAKVFSPIQRSSLVAIRDDFVSTKRYQYSDIWRKSSARRGVVLSNETLERRSRVESVEYLEDNVTSGVLQVCKYTPSYLIRHKLVRFQGARNKSNTRYVEIYPRDSSNESLAIVEGQWWKENAVGNKLLDRGVALDIARTFMTSLKQKYPRKYRLQKIVGVSSTEDKHKGIRFLLNLKLQERHSNSSKFFSKYVFRKKGETTLCFPENFHWNPSAVVHVIVPVKDASAWVLALVKNIEEILTSTNDQKINIVIVDYGSEDLDIKLLFQDSSIENFQVVTLPRHRLFRRAEALQSAVDAIRDPRGILFLCDLHLRMPRNLFTLIRQHCVEGKMAFAPVVKRLRCGNYPSAPYGYWETLGFGLFAIYKSDFDQIGGMDIHTFKEWGGEDWELLDRVLMSGMEVERLKVPEFYHFYHPPLGSSNQRIDA